VCKTNLSEDEVKELDLVKSQLEAMDLKRYPRKQDPKWSKMARIKRTAIALFLPKGEKKSG
jgi:hypothetical protein